MTADPARALMLASRAKKARRRSGCALCPGVVLTGQRIGLTEAGWAHVACIVKANSDAQKEGT